jgi:hypothetical protein
MVLTDQESIFVVENDTRNLSYKTTEDELERKYGTESSS